MEPAAAKSQRDLNSSLLAAYGRVRRARRVIGRSLREWAEPTQSPANQQRIVCVGLGAAFRTVQPDLSTSCNLLHAFSRRKRSSWSIPLAEWRISVDPHFVRLELFGSSGRSTFERNYTKKKIRKSASHPFRLMRPENKTKRETGTAGKRKIRNKNFRISFQRIKWKNC